MPKKETTKQKLLALCNVFNFPAMPSGAIAEYEQFPVKFSDEILTNEFVYGVQEFATIMARAFQTEGLPEASTTVSIYGSAILYQWWKLHVKENEFVNLTEITV